jgi:hypothetical protein
MPKVTYTYKITAVDVVAKTMTITYTSPTYGDIVVCAHLPYKEESLTATIEDYSPVLNWLNSDRKYMDIQVGSTGCITQEVYAPWAE